MEGGGLKDHEFLNPIVGSRVVQAAAVAAGFGNVVIEATCRIGVRPCRVCVCECELEGDGQAP